MSPTSTTPRKQPPQGRKLPTEYLTKYPIVSEDADFDQKQLKVSSRQLTYAPPASVHAVSDQGFLYGLTDCGRTVYSDFDRQQPGNTLADVVSRVLSPFPFHVLTPFRAGSVSTWVQGQQRQRGHLVSLWRSQCTSLLPQQAVVDLLDVQWFLNMRDLYMRHSP